MAVVIRYPWVQAFWFLWILIHYMSAVLGIVLEEGWAVGTGPRESLPVVLTSDGSLRVVLARLGVVDFHDKLLVMLV